MRTAQTIRIAAVASLMLLGLMAPAVLGQESATAVTASAQTPPAQQSQRGPLVFQPVQNGWIIAPEVKGTQFNDHYGTLVGAYIGWLTDESFLVGGSAYWLADGAHDRGMAYGGLTLGWFVPLGSAVRFGARGLIGAGSGTTGVTIAYPLGDNRFGPHGWESDSDVTGGTVTRRFAYSTHFFIAEPEASFIVKLTGWMSIDASVGYRFVGAASGLEDRFRGPTGSIAVRFGSR
jgi:hypothetical protein